MINLNRNKTTKMKKIVISSLLVMLALTGLFGGTDSAQKTKNVPKTENRQTQKQEQPLDWAKFGRYEKANAELKQSPVAVFMGDSITEGWAHIRKDFFKKNNYLGRGISGQTSSEMLVRFRQDVLNLKPQYVAIMAGTNDVAENNGKIKVENTFGNIVSMAELANLHGIKVVLCSVTPTRKIFWREIPDDKARIKKINKMLKDYAKANGYVYVDYYAALVDETEGLPLRYSKDGVHPNADAYTIMEKLVMAALAK